MAPKKKTQKAYGMCFRKATEKLWSYREENGAFTIYDEDGSDVCVLESEEQARLVAKSPELLGQVQEVVLHFPEFDTGGEISGAEAVEFLGLHHETCKETLQHVLGKKLVIDEETGRYARF